MINSIIEINTLTLIISLIALLLGFFIVFFFQKRKYENILKSYSEDASLKLNTLSEKIKTNSLLSDQREESLIESYELKIESLEKQKLLELKNLNEKIELLNNSKEQMKQEFENLANKVFYDNQKKSTTNINQILSPFKEQLNSFGKRVNDIYNDETKQRTSLLGEIKNLKDLNKQISQDAINLTKALKGENKTQGDWGEMILSSILEQTGLREGKEYSIQGSFTDENNKRLRPDVIVHLPSNKDIIIDSKVSLNAYMNYVNSEDENKKQQAVKDLIKSITAHIKGLSSKKYEDIKQLRTLDFVLLFIPIEGAFLLASTKEENLFKMAFENNIMLVSPSTLFVSLRTIENIWKIQHQNDNALEIATKAGHLYDKFALFLSDLEEIGIHISRSQKAYDSAFSKLSTGNGNLLKRSNDLLELGVKTKKKIDTKRLLGE